MKTAKKKNQYCEIHNSIRATLDLSCKMKSKHNKAIRNLNLQNPQCVTNRMTSRLGDDIFLRKCFIAADIALLPTPCLVHCNEIQERTSPRKTLGWTSAGSSAAAELGREGDLPGDVSEAIEDRSEHTPEVLYKALLSNSWENQTVKAIRRELSSLHPIWAGLSARRD